MTTNKILPEKKYPKVADTCEEYYVVGDFELVCGKRNIYGEWILCPACKRINTKEFGGDL